jgi:glycosyltransferase involved in cell wall biosynthesis
MHIGIWVAICIMTSIFGWVIGTLFPLERIKLGRLVLLETRAIFKLPKVEQGDRLSIYAPRTIKRSNKPQSFSIIISYYNNPEGLLAHARLIGLYSKVSIDLIEFIFVDDGSKQFPARDYQEQFFNICNRKCDVKCDVKFVELTEDIGFNSGGAKNTGVLYVKYDRILMMDMDVWLQPSNVSNFLHTTLQPKQYMSDFSVSFNEDPAKGFKHPNIIFINKADFINIGGYNEDFSGRYGYEDLEILKRFNRHHYTMIKEASWVSWLTDSGVGVTSTTRPRNEILNDIIENDKVIHDLDARGFPIPTSMARVPHRLVAAHHIGAPNNA